MTRTTLGRQVVGVPQPRPDEPEHDRRHRERHGHPCANPTCRTWVPRGVLACRTHWLALPALERTRLAAAFRLREAAPDLFRAAVTRGLALLRQQEPS